MHTSVDAYHSAAAQAAWPPQAAQQAPCERTSVVAMMRALNVILTTTEHDVLQAGKSQYIPQKVFPKAMFSVNQLQLFLFGGKPDEEKQEKLNGPVKLLLLTNISNAGTWQVFKRPVS
jgi:hypothetical protein